MVDPLATFSPGTREWFGRAFAAPTPAQQQAWPAIATGAHVLVQAPTGSGKTLAAFLIGIDRLNETPGEGLKLLYVSSAQGSQLTTSSCTSRPARRALCRELAVAVRTGDTPQRERQLMLRKPPDVLITTPESLFLLLTSQRREMLRSVETLILDEVHAVAGTKRGAHLALSLERLERLVAKPMQRIGLSATQRPLEEIGRFVAGTGGRSCSSTPAPARSSTSRSSSLSRTCASSVEPRPVRSGARRRSRDGAGSRWRAARSGRRSTRRCSSSSRRIARRSSSSTTAASPSGSRCGSTSSPRRSLRARITARSRVSSASRSRSC